MIMKDYIYKNLILFVLLFVSMSCFGQFNIKVGYNGAYTAPNKVSEIYSRFNAETTGSKLQAIRYYNGLELGARYKLGSSFGLEVSIVSARGENAVEGFISNTGESITTKWNSALVNYSIGLDNYLGVFGYGASIGYQRLKYTNSTSINSEKRDVFAEYALASKFYLIVESSSSATGFSLRPYVSYNWAPYNLQSLDAEINPSSGLPSSEFDENMVVFGISLLIYNGPQN